MPEISIIVPVYQVEQYLEKCVDSILNQTFSDFELILVDDGSKDRSPEICEEYAKRDTRVKVIHKENGGLSDARNAGLEIATGKYIGFVDSDDYIAADMYEMLYQNLQTYQADMAAVEMMDIYEGRAIKKKYEQPLEVFDQKAAIQAVLDGRALYAYATNKLYKKELFQTVRYPVGKTVEDAYIIIDLLVQCQKIVVINQQKYFYLRRLDSITGQQFSKKNFDVIEAWQKNKQKVDPLYPDLEKNSLRRLCWAYFYVLDKIVASNHSLKDEKTLEIIDYLKQHAVFIKQYPGFTKARRLSFYALMVNIRFYKLFVFIQNYLLKKKNG